MKLSGITRRTSTVLGLAGLVSAFAATPAVASEVRLGEDQYGHRMVQYLADPGETNDVRVDGMYTGGGTWSPFCVPVPFSYPGYCDPVEVSYPRHVRLTFSDPGADIRRVASPCVRSNVHEVTCVFILDEPIGVQVNTGDAADQASTNVSAALNGGSGSDRVTGSPGGDLIHVRDGERDTVDCGGGYDHASADTDDTLSGCEYVAYPTTTGGGKKKR